MKCISFFLFIFFNPVSKAQTAQQAHCSSPEAKQFDFWIGNWNLTWNDTLYGTNHIEKILGSCTIQENFNDPNTKLYR